MKSLRSSICGMPLTLHTEAVLPVCKATNPVLPLAKFFPENTMDYTVALAQVKPKLGCVADNLAMIEEAIERGITSGASLIVFPELALTGYFLKDLVPEVALPLDSPEIRR